MRASALCSLVLLSSLAGAERLSPRQVRARLDAGTLVEADVRDTFGEAKFGEHRTDGVDVAFAVAAPEGAKDLFALNDDETLRVPLKRIGGYAVGVVTVDVGFATRYRFVSGGAPISPIRQFEAYLPDPDASEQPGVAKGELREMGDFKSKIYAGTTRQWFVYLPAGYTKATPANLLVVQDAQWSRWDVRTVLDNLIAKGQIPPTVAVMVTPGGRNQPLDNRSYEYDRLSDDYARMISEELLPLVAPLATLKTDPASRAIMGSSSGGICAFTACWRRPDLFGNCVSWIGSFVDLARLSGENEGGDDYPALIRKTPRKAIRVWLADGTQDLDNDFGNWPLANRQMIRALRFMGYDATYLEGRGFHSGDHSKAYLPSALRWIWRK